MQTKAADECRDARDTVLLLVDASSASRAERAELRAEVMRMWHAAVSAWTDPAYPSESDSGA